ncbi:hypothetical protein ACFWYW_17855 [Nonomuraea sp. NPDC059023]|uniref:hypothetical protein n=1 Tax=unclassified Nonomuraea TaxID=2593643 RepID=UPI003680A8F1
MRLRPLIVTGLALSMLGIGIPAWSADDPRSCNDLMSSDTPAYVMCTWLATPEEAADIARFWLDNDGENMKNAGPNSEVGVDCSEAENACDPNLEGDGEMHDVGSPDVEGSEDGGTPDACPDGGKCHIDPDEVSATEAAAAEKTAAGQSAKTARTDGMRVWIDAELADDWKAGKLAEAAKKVAALAAQPGVVGVRFSSQVGYNKTLQTAEELDKFITEAAHALRQAVPGKKLAIHTVVPALGCGANEACKTEIGKKYPLLDPDKVGAWLKAGLVDQLALDNGHLSTEYATWRIDAAEAQRNQWIQVRARAWDSWAQIAAEDAVFTGPGASQLTAEQATKTITDRVATPLQADAAETVILWTRWQDAKGSVNRVLGDKLADNAAWEQLKKLDAVKARLATIYDPATPEVDQATDLKKLSEVFSTVYVRAA